jgi:hypothetical protein
MGTRRTFFILILLAQVAYSALFISHTAFDYKGQKIFPLFDDTMVSMRYAKNLSEGDGLVFNKGGERVEGFSNLL